jgi:hypothetical protein
MKTIFLSEKKEKVEIVEIVQNEENLLVIRDEELSREQPVDPEESINPEILETRADNEAAVSSWMSRFESWTKKFEKNNGEQNKPTPQNQIAFEGKVNESRKTKVERILVIQLLSKVLFSVRFNNPHSLRLLFIITK